MRKTVLLGLMLFALLVVAGCGSSSSSKSEEEEHSATPAEARAEIGEIRTLLADAVATYKSGDHDAAEQAVGDVYLEHYEEVEGPLGDRNHDLMEELEEQISTDLRTHMKDDKPVAEIDALMGEINTNLDQAEQELS
jgi:hypothetical protein